MYLRHTVSNDLVEITDTDRLTDPCQPDVPGRFHAGEELQEMETFAKTTLVFPSGEALPRCWHDAHYRD